MDKPVIELIKPDGSKILIWNNGKVVGFDGVVINRIPELLNSIFDLTGDAIMGLGEDIKKMKELSNLEDSSGSDKQRGTKIDGS